MPSFEEALRQGADAVELDVHVTVDGAVVVHHDPDLSSSVEPASFRRRALSGLTLGEVRAVDLGRNAHIPVLAEVLALVRGRATAYVEIKAGDVSPVVRAISESGAVCAMHSFDHDAVADAARHSTSIPKGVLLERWPVSLEAIIQRTKARDVWPKASLITAARIEEIHALGCRAIAWTVNDPMLAKQLTSWGIDGLCTDDLTMLPGVQG